MKNKTVRISKAGYKTEEFSLKTCFDPMVWFNVIGFYGFIVDWATGNLVKYDNVYYDIDLEPLTSEQ